MPRTHGANTHRANKSNLFAQIFNPYEVTLSKSAQMNDGLFAHVYKALFAQIKDTLYGHVHDAL